MATIDYMCSVMREAQRGKQIQRMPRDQSPGTWIPVSSPNMTPLYIPYWVDDCSPQWDWDHYEYRVKPKPREFWIVEWATRLHAFDYRETAVDAAGKQLDGQGGRVFHVREVL